MKKLSVCMIVKNEEKVIDRVLNCAKKFADEIIVVDTGSVDKTKDIASKFTKNVFDFEWQEDFSLARNFSILKATGDYFMWLDADDVVDKESIKQLNQLKKNDFENADVIMLPYEIAFDENNKPTFSYFRERILKNNGKFLFQGFVHEVITPSGNIIYKEIPIKHKKIVQNKPKRNLLIYENNIKKGKVLSPREQYYYSNELYYNGLYDRAIEEYNKVISNNMTYTPDRIWACLNLSKIYTYSKDFESAKEILFKTFCFKQPTAEVLCEIGNVFFITKKYKEAIYWYDLATKCTPSKVGFNDLDCYGYVPYLNLAICHYYLGDKTKAKSYNELALKSKPNDKTALSNMKFYEE